MASFAALFRRGGGLQVIEDERVDVDGCVLSVDAVDVTVTGYYVASVEIVSVLFAQEVVGDLRALWQEAGIRSTVYESDGNGQPLEVR